MASLEQPLLAGAEQPDVDVLVVGSGPVGLFMAIELKQRGVSVRIIDRLAKQDIKTKAIGMQKSSFQTLPPPVVNRILKESTKVKAFRVHEVVGNKRTTLANLGQTAGTNEYSQMECIEQWKSERFLEDHLRGLGVTVERGTALKDFTNKWDYVEVELGGEGRPTTRLRASFLVGCDGGSSFVRKKLGFEFHGDVAKETFASCHALIENGPAKAEQSDVWLGKSVPGGDPLVAGMCISLPLHDGEHLINVDLDEKQQEAYLTDEVDSHGLRKLKQLTREDIVALLRARTACPELTIRPEKVTWISHYRVNSRLSEHFGSGRVYLAGDACHCHSPVGGQGMNMGIQDAKNLAWKLAAVVKKAADPKLLLTYEEERRNVDAKITKSVHFATSTFSARNPIAFFLRGRPPRVIGATLSMLPNAAKTARGWSYDGSSLAHEHWERPSLCATLKDVLRNPWAIYRRRQNFHRWSGAVGARVCAGSSVPPVLIDGENLYDAIRASRGWTLLIFEGDPGANDAATRSGVSVMSFKQLQTLGQELRQAPDSTGYVSFVDRVIVFPSSELEAHATFGVQGQCLFAVRPDTYVGLRCEPVRKGAVTRYFHGIGGLGVPAHPCPASTSNFDALPATLLAVILSIIATATFRS